MLTPLADGEVTQRWPQGLPGGKAVLFTSSRNHDSYDDATLVVQLLPAGPRKAVLRGGSHGRYLPSGHLVYLHKGTLFAVPFDLDQLEVPPLKLHRIEDASMEGLAKFARRKKAEAIIMGLTYDELDKGIPKVGRISNFAQRKRVGVPKAAAPERKQSFAKMELCYTDEQGAEEALRCMGCDVRFMVAKMLSQKPKGANRSEGQKAI